MGRIEFVAKEREKEDVGNGGRVRGYVARWGEDTEAAEAKRG